MTFKEITAVQYEHHSKQINTLCGQNAVLWIINTGGI